MIPNTDPPDAHSELILHASCVALDGRALLILGRAGSGKSSLALGLMALGASLVADDRTVVSRREDSVFASAPKTIAGLIEARGVGLLFAEAVQEVPISAIADLDASTTERLPQDRTASILGREFPLIHGPITPFLPSAILQFFKGGRYA